MNGIAAVLLAGGQSRRMGGGDKCLQTLGGQTILERIIDRMTPQVERMVLNANGDPARFHPFELEVAADLVEGFAGPLAGILTGMRWAEHNAPDLPWLLSVPTDAPFLPGDLAVRLQEAVNDAVIVRAASGGRSHPVVALWRVSLADDLEAALAGGIRKIDLWTARHNLAEVIFDDQPVDPFLNVNRAEDLEEAEALLAQTED